MRNLGFLFLLGGSFLAFVFAGVNLFLSGWADMCKPEEKESVTYLRSRAEIFGILTWLLGVIPALLGLGTMLGAE